MKSPRVLIAMNAFKGSLSNREACAAVAEALTTLKIPFLQIPVGDGGRGSRDTIRVAWGGEIANLPGIGPMGAETTAQVLCAPNASHPEKIFIDSPDICGYSLVSPMERNPMQATSRGLGELLLRCHKLWNMTLKEIYIGLGDSAVSDAGIGMLGALGFQFLDGQGRSVSGNGEGLARLANILPAVTDPLEGIRLSVLCDVTNPLCGPSGSARVFAPQKGASPQDVERLSQGMDIFAEQVRAISGREIAQQTMTGSAGGLAAALYGLMNADLLPGAKYLFDQVGFDEHLRSCDLLVTGEGKTDKQTLSGKAPRECLSRAKALNKSALILSGSLGEGVEFTDNPKFLGCFACGREPTAYEALRREAQRIFSDLRF